MTKIEHFFKWLDETKSAAATTAAVLIFLMLLIIWFGLVIALLIQGSILAGGFLAFGPPTVILYLIYRLETKE